MIPLILRHFGVSGAISQSEKGLNRPNWRGDRLLGRTPVPENGKRPVFDPARFQEHDGKWI